MGEEKKNKYENMNVYAHFKSKLLIVTTAKDNIIGVMYKIGWALLAQSITKTLPQRPSPQTSSQVLYMNYAKHSAMLIMGFN